MILKSLQRLQRIAWFAMIATLPLTSMPLVKKLLGSDSVASPAVVILFVLIFLWTAGLFFGGKMWGSTKILPLALFCCTAVIATLISLFYKTPAFKDFGQSNPVITALGTLVIGFLFFFLASSFPIDNEIKIRTLKIINWAGLVILIWCAIQAVAWYGSNHYPQWMFSIQGAFSARVLYRQRVTGFALEPSWLAHQLNMLYLPFWISASMTGYTSHSFRLRKLSLENILMIGGIAALGLTLSRVGFAALLFMAALAYTRIHPRLVSNVHDWAASRQIFGFKPDRKVISKAMFIGYVLILAILIFIFSKIDPRMATLFKFSFDQDNPLLRYFNQLKFGDRVVYWLTGWNIFNEFPILGVGLGNAGFYFPKNIPPYGWSLLEVRRLMYRSHLLLNVKSLWFRLLAETGIVGFSLFAGWIISLVSFLTDKYRSINKQEQMMGFAGLLVVIGITFEGLSIDSFAMPYWWISLGLAVASYKK